MSRLDEQHEQQVRQFAGEIQSAAGAALQCVALYGSGAGEDWVSARSDVNTAIVLERVTTAALDALAPVVARWRKKGFALPLVVDAAYLRRACESFPMEIEDIRQRHRVILGADPFAGLTVERATLARELEQEAQGKLLRLRAFYLEHAGQPRRLEELMRDSLKSFLILLRHLVCLCRGQAPATHGETLAAGEALLGPLPSMRRVYALRQGGREGKRDLADLSRGYIAEVERLVAEIERKTETPDVGA